MNRWKVHLNGGDVVEIPISYQRISKENGDYLFDRYPNIAFYPTDIVGRFPKSSVKYIEGIY